MIFPSEKKRELWRYASRNNPATCDADGIPKPTQLQQPLLPPHQHHPQTLGSSCYCANKSSTMRQPNTPPPPYCSIPCSIDCSGSYPLPRNHHKPVQDHHQLKYLSDSETDMSMSVEKLDNIFIKGGCGYERFGADMLIEENGSGALSTTLAPPDPTPAATFVMTAANMFRNCCGGGYTTDSSSGSIPKANPPDSSTPTLTSTCPIHPQSQTISTALSIVGAITPTTVMHQRKLNQMFNTLLKPFKKKQIGELLQAVKSRVDPPGNSTIISTSPSYLQCILIRCTSPVDEEQHMITCQLFFWSDLRDAGELRRLPTCRSAMDSIYICCNPLHWYRIIHIIDSESAPPPYQRSKMLRLRDTDSEGNTQNIERSSGVSWSTGNSSLLSQSISSIIKKQAESQLFVPNLESFTTDGKVQSACPQVWCQIAYWELSQRVGELFQAKKNAVNVYADAPAGCSGESMCLRDLGGKSCQLDAVQPTRQKIGLGVTMSLECGDVWIYNRSNVPIFVDSPTLAERLDRVCKVLPGYCIKAFETHRAEWLAFNKSHNNQLGPIDRFSMKISFVKGWGNTYRRQDVMRCPCWLEVHFSHLR